MPREARKLSDYGYLHVMQRGIGKQLLFEDDEDYQRYIDLLDRFSRETEVSVCVYCLMQNHTHLLLRDSDQRIPLMMKKLGVSYSYYFNQKYERSGHLFQDRYHSETVEDDAYLMMVVRYILNNPRKAGIAETENYPWSSYSYYYGSRKTFVSTQSIEELMGNAAAFTAYVAEENSDQCLEFSISDRHDDKWALQVIHRKLQGQSGTCLQHMDPSDRDKALRELKKAGVSVRQLERLTGITRGVIQRV